MSRDPFLDCVSRSARGTIAATIAASAVKTIEPVVENGERSGPAKTIDADDRNQIAREHDPRVGPRRELAQMLGERRRPDLSRRR